MSWILLRGLSREARHWGGFTPQFEAMLRETHADKAGRALALDLPGNGEFCRETSPSSVREITDFARRQLQARGVAPPHQLMAMSLGGMVACDWAQRYPGEISRLVLINTSMRPYSRTTERLRPGSWLALALTAARWRNADAAEQAIHHLTCNDKTSLDEDLAAWRRIRNDAPVSVGNAWRQLRAAGGFVCDAAPACPVLILSSAADQLVDPQCSARLAHAWQAPHHQHQGAGHDLPHDEPGWVCARVADWLTPASELEKVKTFIDWAICG